MRSSRSRFHRLRGLRYHVREWGPADAAAEQTLVMLHGWMDVSASFQFVVDELPAGLRVLAPDWRGYGLSDRTPADSYWFPDYLADLDLLLDQLCAEAPLNLVGHSMGGNVAMLYAGIRPQRIRTVVNLEGFGLRSTRPEEAPARYARWMDELRAGSPMRDYGSLQEVAERLRRNNPRLSAQRALFLAAHWSHQEQDGRWRVAGDPAHKLPNPTLYRWEEVAECWKRIAAPVLWIQAADTDAHRWAGEQSEIDARRGVVPQLEAALVDDAGHMLHHDQPEQVARLIEAFLDRHRG
jgi:pimeloyl-ACP methyl ester carboxylesterase